MGMYNREDNLRALGLDPWAEVDTDPKPEPQKPQRKGSRGYLILAAIVIAAMLGLLFALHGL